MARVIDAEAGDEVTAHTTFVGQGGAAVLAVGSAGAVAGANYAQIMVHT